MASKKKVTKEEVKEEVRSAECGVRNEEKCASGGGGESQAGMLVPHSTVPLPYVGTVAGYSCPFCGSQNLEYRARVTEGAAAVHFRCRDCKRNFSCAPRELKTFKGKK